MTNDLRVGVVGAGVMGSDHIARLTHRISGARVVSVIEPDDARAAAAAQLAPGARTHTDLDDALAQDELDAVVIVTPGQFHETALLAALDAGVGILCEKPLTRDSESSLRVLQAEQKQERPRIQVGFMRRFDPEYRSLRGQVESRALGELLLLTCAHRNPSVPAGYTEQMLITDSVVHEFDVVAWLADSPVRAIEVRKLRRNSKAPGDLAEPQLVTIELQSGVVAQVEISVSVGFGYEVTTEASFERGVSAIGRGTPHASFITRFAEAYDAEVQRWVDAARRGTIDGPSAWDGYLAAAACEAGVEAQATGRPVELTTIPQPSFYR